MNTITIDDLKKMSLVELKAFIYDQNAAMQRLEQGIKIANEIILEKSKLPEVDAEAKPKK